jgi:hypothetical protein
MHLADVTSRLTAPGTTAQREPLGWPKPPLSRNPVSSKKVPFRSLRYRVALPSRLRASHRIFWMDNDYDDNDDGKASAFDEWLAIKEQRDNEYLEYIKTAERQDTRTVVERRLPGMQVEPESSSGVDSFLGDMSTSASCISRLVNAMMRDATHQPLLSPRQLLLLVLLTSRTRRMTDDQIMRT